ncbi:SRPBCC domain-containing protein [Pollutibacter soli]|uniref:SRPBCC family protein n=1 Tax=Pollutibacter soli TaxID=3034157 RepID=UPI003013B5EA
MKNLLFEFDVDKIHKTVTVEREFDAPVEKVWAAWTDSSILDQWWAPKPYRAETKSQNFRVGGTWMYAMVSPENEYHWCRADYTAIVPQKKVDWLDAFCDEKGNINDNFPRSGWKIQFSENDNTTHVHIVINHEKLEDLEKIMEMGFREGFTMGLENLDKYLAK